MKSKLNPNDPAFPQHGWTNNPEILKRMEKNRGMTIRAMLAAAALQGICTRSFPETKIWKKPFVEYAAPAAVELADALIKELNK